MMATTAKRRARTPIHVIAGVVAILAIAIGVVVLARNKAAPASAPCSTTTFTQLVEGATGAPSTSTITNHACSGRWAIAAFDTKFPGETGSQSGVAVFKQASGTWGLIIGPYGGICLGAMPGTLCDGQRVARYPQISYKTLLSLIKDAGLRVANPYP